MNVLVTGSGGYLGARLVEHLSVRHKVKIIGPTLSEELYRPLGAPITVVNADWSDPGGMHSATKGIDIIIHAYGLNASACGLSVTKALTFNAIHTANLLEAGIKNGIKTFVYLSTAHVYGELEGCINEESRTNPVHPYGFSKRAGENAVGFLANQSQAINYKILRLANVFGPPTPGNNTCWDLLVNDLCRQAIHSGSLRLRSNGLSSRNFLTMYDFLAAIEFFLDEGIKNGIYNLGAEESIKVIYMANLIARRFESIFGVKLEIYKNDTDNIRGNSIYYDCSKLKQEGFNFTNNFEKAIDETLKLLALEKGIVS